MTFGLGDVVALGAIVFLIACLASRTLLAKRGTDGSESEQRLARIETRLTHLGNGRLVHARFSRLESQLDELLRYARTADVSLDALDDRIADLQETHDAAA